MNSTLETEKKMNYLNYSNALRDCFEFPIAQRSRQGVSESGNVACLSNWPGMLKM